MPITVGTLREASKRASRPFARTLTEARALNVKTVFLCHSHRDSALVQDLVTLLLESGWKAYVDWADTHMPDIPNRETAARLRQKILELDYFLYLATPNSGTSRWCPWEIGYADGRKPIDRIIVCPTSEGSTTHGSEYLDLYRRLDLSNLHRLAVWRPRDSDAGVLVSNL